MGCLFFAKRLFRCSVAILCFPLLIACGNSVSTMQNAVVGDTLKMSHAHLLQIVECDSFTLVDIKNPWKEGLLHRYLLVPKETNIPANMPQGTLLRTPLDNLLLFSSVHASLLQDLGEMNAVKGVCDSRYMLLPAVHEKIAQGVIEDCGSTLNIDVEKVVQISPEAIMVLPFENGGYGKIDKLSFPVVECVEYMEHSPLAAAEWMRFYGRLVGKAPLADSLFSTVKNRFYTLRALVDTCANRPTLMCELKSSSAWYMPAAQSTMGQMYKTAGAHYLFDDNNGSGSLPLSYETVLSRAVNADLWLFKYNSSKDKTYTSLVSEFSGYSHFKPFKTKSIYVCNTGKKPFYEETPFHPDLLLSDLIAIFHPLLLPEHKLRYYEKMQE